MRKKVRSCLGCLGTLALFAILFIVARTSPTSTLPPTPAPPPTPIPNATREWYSGGNLHDAELWQWQNATYHNKLATVADMIVVVGKDHLTDEPALRNWAEQTVICIDTVMDTAIAQFGKRAKIADFALVCLSSLKP